MVNICSAASQCAQRKNRRRTQGEMGRALDDVITWEDGEEIRKKKTFFENKETFEVSGEAVWRMTRKMKKRFLFFLKFITQRSPAGPEPEKIKGTIRR